MGRYLGIDYGTVRIGLALTDPFKIISSAYKTIPGGDGDSVFAQLAKIITEESVEKIILGYPIGLNEQKTVKTLEVEAFAEKLKRLNIPIELWDESFTSVKAHQVMKQMKKKTGHNKDMVDQIAASIMLKDYLDCNQ